MKLANKQVSELLEHVAILNADRDGQVERAERRDEAVANLNTNQTHAENELHDANQAIVKEECKCKG